MIESYDLSVSYRQQAPALKNISFRLDGPTITGIIGPNGAGKSTLLKSMLNIIPHSGEVTFVGTEKSEAHQKIAYVEQKSAVDFTFPITVKEFVSLGTYPQVGLFRRLKPKHWQKVATALEQVGLSEFSKRQISELSGGQFQRILIARCLVQESDYIFLDEPFVGIDSISEEIIVKILQELKDQGKMILVVHHDLSKVENYFDQLILLNRELIDIGKTAEVFNQENLRKTYGDHLFWGGLDND